MTLGFDTTGFKDKLERYRFILMIVVNAGIFAAIFFLLIMPQYDSMKKLELQHKEVTQDYEMLVGVQKGMAQYKKEYAAIQEKFEKALAELPERKDIPNIVRTMALLGGETRVKVRFFEPKQVTNRDFYGELPIEMRYVGSYQNLGAFFDEIRRMQRIVQVPTFSLETKGPPGNFFIEGSCIAKTFLYVQPPKDAKGTKG
jgi:type IV pilus assembly protein PilO